MRSIVERFLGDRRGTVLIFAVLSLPVVIGAAALAIEYGNALRVRVENQRVADLASFAGAMAYTTTNAPGDMTAAALNVAALNGVAGEFVSVDLVASPRSPSVQSVNVRIATPESLILAGLISDRLDLSVSAQSFAEIGSTDEEEGDPGCILALATGGSGVTLSGGTKVVAPKCIVASNATVTVPCGTQIKALGVTYDAANPPSQPCGGIITEAGNAAPVTRINTPDPLAGNAAVATAAARLDPVGALAAPASPAVAGGTSIEFAWNQNGTKAAATAAGCTAAWAQPIWTLTCSGRSTFNFGDITIGGGIVVDFNVNGAASTTYNFSGGITNSGGSTMRFGPGTYNIAKGIINSGTLMTFKAGTFSVGRATATCAGAKFSVCNTSTLTFAGPSTFELASGFASTGSGVLTFGEGAANSYRLGPSSTGNAIDLGGGSKVYMGDATSGVFEVKGNIVTGGGGCFFLPAATEHDISGNVSAAGGIQLGSGVYTIDGYLALGANGGGAVNCRDGTIAIKGRDVSIVLSGRATPPSGSCKGYAFCIGAGYSGVELVAPLTGPMAKLVVIGPQAAGVSAGLRFTEGGANGRLAGVLYFPHGPMLMSGGADVSGVADHCLQIIATTVTLNGGTTAASECLASASPGGEGSAGRVSIVQ